jgi:hypothetical protein
MEEDLEQLSYIAKHYNVSGITKWVSRPNLGINMHMDPSVKDIIDL